MDRREAIALCLELPDAWEDYPFHDPNWTVMRHKSNQKSFAMIFEHQAAFGSTSRRNRPGGISGKAPTRRWCPPII